MRNAYRASSEKENPRALFTCGLLVCFALNTSLHSKQLANVTNSMEAPSPPARRVRDLPRQLPHSHINRFIKILGNVSERESFSYLLHVKWLYYTAQWPA
jgi:hypothetical protein